MAVVTMNPRCYCFPPISTGIGFETAKVLCGKGYDVTIACRDPTRAQNAVSALKAADPAASISYVIMDLANLQSVRDAAAAWLDSGKQIDVLLNNAGKTASAHLCGREVTVAACEWCLFELGPATGSSADTVHSKVMQQ